MNESAHPPCRNRSRRHPPAPLNALVTCHLVGNLIMHAGLTTRTAPSTSIAMPLSCPLSTAHCIWQLKSSHRSVLVAQHRLHQAPELGKTTKPADRSVPWVGHLGRSGRGVTLMLSVRAGSAFKFAPPWPCCRDRRASYGRDRAEMEAAAAQTRLGSG